VVLELHAGCAACGSAGVLLLGAPGAGKSDLLLRLLAGGFDLVADDRVMVEDGQARAPEALAGLLEVRGLGIVRRPFRDAVSLVLAVALDEAAWSDACWAPDVPEGDRAQLRLPWPATHRRLGLPMIRLDGAAASAPLRVALALDCLEGRAALMVGGV